MLEIESEPMVRVYEIDIPKEQEILSSNKSNKLKKIVANLNVSDHISDKIKKRMVLGFELFIISAHVAFLFLRLLNF